MPTRNQMYESGRWAGDAYLRQHCADLERRPLRGLRNSNPSRLAMLVHGYGGPWADEWDLGRAPSRPRSERHARERSFPRASILPLARLRRLLRWVLMPGRGEDAAKWLVRGVRSTAAALDEPVSRTGRGALGLDRGEANRRWVPRQCAASQLSASRFCTQ